MSRSQAARIPVTILWACFLLRGAFYSLVFPLWEGYDEYAHFAYVQHLAETGGIAPGSRTPVSREVAESLLLVPLPFTLENLDARAATHDTYWQLPEDERRRRREALFSLPRALAREAGPQAITIYEAQQPPLYYWLMHYPYRAIRGLSLPARALALRLLSVVAASLFIPLAFLASRRVLGGEPAALGAVALICAMPGLLISLARVGNDGPPLVLYGLLICASLEFVARPGRVKPFLLAGAALGLGLLSKAYFLTALPAFGACAACAALRLRERKTHTLSCAVLGLAIAAATGGWWYLRNWLQTGTVSGLMQAVELRNMPMVELLKLVPQVKWLDAVDSTFFSHIWFGNWSFLQLRWWIYHVFRCGAWLAVLGLLAAAWRRARSRSTVAWARGSVPVLLAYYGFFVLGLAYHVLITYAASGKSSSAGWYLYCVVVAEVLLVALGLYTILPSRVRLWVLPAVTGAFTLLDLYGMHFVLVPYYTGVIRHNPNGALATLSVPQLLDFGFQSLVERLLANKPAGIAATMIVSGWLLYLAATLAAPALAVRIAARRGNVGRRPPERG